MLCSPTLDAANLHQPSCASVVIQVFDSNRFFVILKYVQNIFLGEDIRKQLPAESAEFDDVNANWKIIMTRLHKDNNAKRGTHHPGKPVQLLKWDILSILH